MTPRGDTRRIAVGGIIALAVAMGIGRFAFTPMLPLMLRDNALDAAGGAEWAAANYAGYLLGALTAHRAARVPRLGIAIGLWGVALTTTLAGLPGLLPAGPLLRGLAGVFSAWVLVAASAWALPALARRGAAASSAAVFSGVGLGIAAAGLLTWLGGRQPAAWLWIELGALAAIGTFLVRPDKADTPPPPAASTTGPAPSAWGPVLCYGTFGFGYIIPATFLPAMARAQVSDPLVFGLTWPLFGTMAAASVLVAARFLANRPRRTVWAIAQASMAIGTALPLASQSLPALALSASFVGGTFMLATMSGLQIARELAPANPTPLLARMTIAFALGQIAGPILVRLAGPAGIDAALAAATILLAATALWLWRAPLEPPPRQA